MTEPAATDNTQIILLARALESRVSELSEAAATTVRGIEDDRRRIGVSGDGHAQAGDLIAVVIERVGAIGADCHRLSGILQGFDSLAREGGDEPVAEVPAAPREPLIDDPAEEAPQVVAVGLSDANRLLATKMSIAGASEGEIAQRLRDAHGVENADLLVGELLGPAARRPG